MKIYYDGKKSKELQNLLVDKWHDQSKYGGDTEHNMEEHENIPHGSEYHVYSLIVCPMKYVCQTLNLERTLTQENIGMMFIGIVAQKLIQWLYPPDQRERVALFPNVAIGHMDVYEQF